jgi:putative RecB family exonuclease
MADEALAQRADSSPVGKLSPSRASDFTTCPLLYRFRTIDRFPEPPSPATARGTLVHLVLERLFDVAAEMRTPQAAAGMIDQAWQDLLARNPDYQIVHDEIPLSQWIAECETHINTYFRLEDPRAVEPTKREEPVEVQISEDLLLRGFVDRIDIDEDGLMAVIDYKTGKAPPPAYEAKAMFQMKFYALVLWKQTGSIPKTLRLMYLGDGSILEYTPDESDLNATQRRVSALWAAIKRCMTTGDFPANPSALCRFCNHHQHCPQQGGQLPPMPTQRTSTPTPDVETNSANA